VRSGRCRFAFSGMADRVLARLAQSSEVLLTRARCDGGALLLNIRPAGVADCHNAHERRLAWLAEIFEVHLNAFCKRICLLTVSTGLHDVLSAGVYD